VGLDALWRPVQALAQAPALFAAGSKPAGSDGTGPAVPEYLRLLSGLGAGHA